jgi:hypothetical protein
MTYTETIGKIAGKVWHHLNDHGKTSLSGLEKAVKAPRGVVFMAIGWLAREGNWSSPRRTARPRSGCERARTSAGSGYRRRNRSM